MNWVKVPVSKVPSTEEEKDQGALGGGAPLFPTEAAPRIKTAKYKNRVRRLFGENIHV